MNRNVYVLESKLRIDLPPLASFDSSSFPHFTGLVDVAIVWRNYLSGYCGESVNKLIDQVCRIEKESRLRPRRGTARYFWSLPSFSILHFEGILSDPHSLF